MRWIPKEDRYCVDCDTRGVSERKRCKSCAKEYCRKAAARRFKEHGRHFYGYGKCAVCGKKIKLWRREQLFCIGCGNTSTGKHPNVVNRYISKSGKSGFRHREIAESILGRSLGSNEVSHHIDEDPVNNSVYNLVVMSRKLHGRLHRFLRNKYGKLNVEGDIANWPEVRRVVTVIWFMDHEDEIIKLWEV